MENTSGQCGISTNRWRTPPDIVNQHSVPPNGLVHREATPLRMLSHPRRTHVVQLITVILVLSLSLLSHCHSTGNLARAKHPSCAANSSTHSSTYGTFCARTPASSGIPRSVFPDSGTHPDRLPQVSLSTLERPLVLLPRKGGHIPMLNGSCHSSLESSEHPPAIFLHNSSVHTMRQN